MNKEQNDIAIRVENLSKCYQIYDTPRDRLKQFILPRVQRVIGRQPKQYFREFWALKDISFEVKKGETIGIIGRNGSGKSTLLQMICGTLSPTSGSITTHGRIAALLELGSGFNPEFTGRENVYMNASVLGLSQEETDARFDDIVAFADIGEFIEQPVKTYSSGMMVRLAFSVAINVAPDILIVDEALAVGDAAFQRKCMRKIGELSDSGVTLLFVSHDLETVKKICSEALYLIRGEMIEFGVAKQVCISYECDLFGASKKSETSQIEAQADLSNSDQAILDPDLLGTNEKIYGDGRSQITGVMVTNKNRHITNVLNANTEFIVSYRAKFLAEVSFPIFGMMITNREGVCIFGTNTENHLVSKRHFAEGDEVVVEFHLTNHLGPGIFYLTCGIYTTENSDSLIYLQRRMDVLIIKVIADNDSCIGGVANLNSKIVVTE
ncbi:ABC transporter ATP-binding protein [Nitrosomonas eutropha]|uniref:Lipopolysaccharide transport system ATP-binding protein n=2 Tax=Nitrosomonas eutropha TaxID=916 RepID=A0ABX5MAC1_9PROT|nr:ABC transporter ATP-binding protein [Nitrosomonas eutropha]ABI58440.1 ABC transporter-related protein [Nitrosomonas eutropha C91]PXV84263.1 lipopolysaccharide transport system ATP-binding protein [Nitrosomonas eutropha]